MQRVLVLNSFYQPSQVVSWERAVCLLFDGKAETVESTDEVLRSPSVQMMMPSIIRMKRKTRARKMSIKFSRTNVFLRDGHKCQYCKGSFEEAELNYDHVLPRSRGGRTEWDNIVASCYPCNEKKGNKTPDEAKMPLQRQPRKPTWLPMVARLPARSVPDSWRVYFQQAA